MATLMIWCWLVFLGLLVLAVQAVARDNRRKALEEGEDLPPSARAIGALFQCVLFSNITAILIFLASR